MKMKIIALTVIVCFVFSSALVVTSAKNQEQQGKKQKIEMRHTHKVKVIHKKYIKLAVKLGIDTTGMTNDEIKAAIKAVLLARQTAKLIEKATELGIDTTGMTNDQIKAVIKTELLAGQTTKLIEKATELGIDTTGMTNDQIKVAIKLAIETTKLIEKATALGIDTTGMTNDQIKVAIKDALKAMGKAHKKAHFQQIARGCKK